MLKSAILALVLIVVLVGCGPTSQVPPEPPKPVVSEYTGAAAYSGGAGQYIVECTGCSAMVSSARVCHDDMKDVGVTPTLSVSHDGVSQETNNMSSNSAAGVWIIRENGLSYYRGGHYGTGGPATCTASADFVVVMTKGGTITKLP